MTVKERLVKYIRYIKSTNRAFSLSIGMSQNYVSSIRKSVQPEVITTIAVQYPDLNTGWLLTGEGEMLKPKENKAGNTNTVINKGRDLHLRHFGDGNSTDNYNGDGENESLTIEKQQREIEFLQKENERLKGEVEFLRGLLLKDTK